MAGPGRKLSWRTAAREGSAAVVAGLRSGLVPMATLTAQKQDILMYVSATKH